jgi:hydroxyacylglutathione hydrolase
VARDLESAAAQLQHLKALGLDNDPIGGPGRTQTPELLAQEIELITSRLYTLPDNLSVYPGHGANTTVGASKAEYAVFASKPHDPALSGDVNWLTS